MDAVCDYDLAKCPPELRQYAPDNTTIACVAISVRHSREGEGEGGGMQDVTGMAVHVAPADAPCSRHVPPTPACAPPIWQSAIDVLKSQTNANYPAIYR